MQSLINFMKDFSQNFYDAIYPIDCEIIRNTPPSVREGVSATWDEVQSDKEISIGNWR